MASEEKKISKNGGAIVVSDAHFPLLISTWFGTPDKEIIEFYFEWQAIRLAHARDSNTRVVTIIDALDAARPAASMRKTIAEHSEKILEGFAPIIVHSRVVVESALVRGAITAIY